MTSLESEVETLKTTLEAAQADVEAKASAVSELEQAKAKAEEELAAVRQSLETLQSDQSSGSSQLETVRAEVCLSLMPEDVSLICAASWKNPRPPVLP